MTGLPGACYTYVSPSTLSKSATEYIYFQELPIPRNKAIPVVTANLPQYHVGLTKPLMYKEGHVFGIFVPVLTTLCVLALKVLELFCAFKVFEYSVNVFVRYELWVNVSVAIFVETDKQTNK